MATLAEFTNRYGKIHGASKPSIALMRAPNNIPLKKKQKYHRSDARIL